MQEVPEELRCRAQRHYGSRLDPCTYSHKHTTTIPYIHQTNQGRIQDFPGGDHPKGSANLLFSQIYRKTVWKCRNLGRGTSTLPQFYYSMGIRHCKHNHRSPIHILLLDFLTTIGYFNYSGSASLSQDYPLFLLPPNTSQTIDPDSTL